MKKIIMGVIAGVLVIGANICAASGDLIVNGNVGVGTGSPGAKLEVVGGDLKIGTNNKFLYGVNTGSSARKLIGITSVNTIEIAGSGQDAIFPSGNVGIGTTNPQASLHVYGVGPGNPGALKLQNGNGKTWQLGEILANNNFEIYDVVIGSRFTILGSNGNVGIGTTSPAFKLDVKGQVASNGVVLTSDAKFKKNLLSINDSLSKVVKLKGVSYEWKKDEYKDKGFPEGRHYGVIAQEIEKVLPEVVSTAPDGTKAVAYMEIIPVLIEAIKEQQKKIERLEKILSEKK